MWLKNNAIEELKSELALLAAMNTIPEPKASGKTELEEQAERMGITVNKLQAMKDYAIQLRRSDRRIKESTVRKKVLEKFKIQLT